MCIFSALTHLSWVHKHIMHIHMLVLHRLGLCGFASALSVEEVALQLSCSAFQCRQQNKNKCSSGSKLWKLLNFLDHSVLLLMQIHECALISMKATWKDLHWLYELNHNWQKYNLNLLAVQKIYTMICRKEKSLCQNESRMFGWTHCINTTRSHLFNRLRYDSVT